MKKHLTILFAMGMALFVLSCESEEGSGDADPQSISDAELEKRILEMENCQYPNLLQDTRCCSLKGTYGGTCAVNREWISNGGCSMVEVEGDNLEICCGGRYLVQVGARGFQCVQEL